MPIFRAARSGTDEHGPLFRLDHEHVHATGSFVFTAFISRGPRTVVAQNHARVLFPGYSDDGDVAFIDLIEQTDEGRHRFRMGLRPHIVELGFRGLKIAVADLLSMFRITERMPEHTEHSEWHWLELSPRKCITPPDFDGDGGGDVPVPAPVPVLS